MGLANNYGWRDAQVSVSYTYVRVHYGVLIVLNYLNNKVNFYTKNLLNFSTHYKNYELCICNFKNNICQLTIIICSVKI